MTSTMKIENGNQVWRNADGEFHRIDGPAVIDSDGSEEWWVNDKLHRLDGPAVILSNGTQMWFVNGKRHRLDGPAVIDSYGRQEWWVDRKRHRVDGPAVIYTSGFKEWWVNYNFVDPAFISQHIKHDPPTPKEQQLLIEYWGEGSS